MIDINGTTIATPKKCSIGVFDISSAAARNAAGDTVIDRVAVKRKLDLEWGPLTNAAISVLLTAVAAQYFSVAYPDPVTGAAKTIVCYVSERTAPILKYTGATPMWESLKMTLTER
jgi:hypothetical protein